MKSKPIAYLVVGLVGIFALASLIATYDLIRLRSEASHVAIMSGLCGTALGYVGGLLASTERSQKEE